MDQSKFKHRIQIRVRNYEVDWQGIVHNANYLLYFEVGRVEYLKHIGIRVDLNAIKNDSRIVLVRNEIDYKAAARFDEVMNIYTRIIYIRNSSFAFEGLMEEATSKRLVSENTAVHVWLDPRTNNPIPVNDDFRNKIRQFEGDNVAIQGPILFT
ncbi:MAG: acyl-CoA thioesterase [Ignavibacteria bacterium]|nr:acyl-CoA thioesterase [Ignavibacteria bacterium]